FVFVREQVVGLRDIGETLGGFRIVAITIGVQLLGELAIGGLDVFFARATLDAECRIGICHGVLARQNSAGAQARRRFPIPGLTDRADRMKSDQEAIPHGDPFALFDAWFAEAASSEPNDANAMALATATPDGAPSVRMVLLKGRGPDGFVFYTNVQSRKGEEIRANPRAALLFHWKSLGRQIRIEGPLEEVGAEQADAYFASRHPDSRLGSAASDQSRPLDA